MKIIFSVVLSVVVTLAFCRPSYATECTTDIDCNMYNNERCIKEADNNRGVCVEAKKALNRDRKPASSFSSSPSSTPPPAKRGKFCMTNSDCDPGQSCVKKGSGDLNGMCY